MCVGACVCAVGLAPARCGSTQLSLLLLADMSKTREFPLGAEVEVVTRAQETVCGHVFAHDTVSNVVVLSVPLSASLSGSQEQPHHLQNDRQSYRLFNAQTIASARVVDANAQLAPLGAPALSQEQVKRREAIALRQAYEESQRIGVDVSLEAQQVFNQLCKTYACRTRACV
jgi:protein LSM12